MGDHWVLMPFIDNWDMTKQAVEDCLAQTLPTRVLLIDQGSSKESREQADAWIDQQNQPFTGSGGKVQSTQYNPRVLCWHYLPALPSLSAVWNRALAFVWELGVTEALVVNNDLRLHRDTLQVICAVLRYEKALFVSAVGVKEEQFDGVSPLPLLWTWTGWLSPISTWEPEHSPVIGKGGPDFSCFLISKAGHDKYPFDESFIPAYGEDCDMHRRYMLGGDGDKIFSVNLPFLHYASGTIKAYSPEQRAKFNKGYEACLAYYARCWGGKPNQETLTVKGDPASAREGVTTPDLQRRVQAGHPAVPDPLLDPTQRTPKETATMKRAGID